MCKFPQTCFRVVDFCFVLCILLLRIISFYRNKIEHYYACIFAVSRVIRIDNLWLVYLPLSGVVWTITTMRKTIFMISLFSPTISMYISYHLRLLFFINSHNLVIFFRLIDA